MRLHDISKDTSVSEKTLSIQELKKLHRVLLMMLKDLKEICKKYNLKFILIGGSAIGAIRHQGFIPWDDDIDIAICRADYEKLLIIIRRDFKHKYILSDARDTDNYGKIIPKLRLIGTKYITFLDDKNENPGVKMDIFIIENTFNNIYLRYLHGYCCMFFGFALSCLRINRGWKKYSKISNNFNLKLKAILGFLFSFASIEKWAFWTERCYALCKNNDSLLVTVPSDGPHYFKGLTSRTNLCNVIERNFEDEIMWLPTDVDNYLTSIYGDYLILPPVSKQVCGIYEEFDLGSYDNI